MNYRHIYHAGNFADIVKHSILTMAIDYLVQKEKGLFLLDAFAGCGHYDLSRHEAGKTKEFSDGIGRIMSVASLNADLRKFQNIMEPDWKAEAYPGSPLLMARALRSQDRMIANELHPEDFESLRQTLKPFPAARVTRMDAYESIRANIPPAERRGLVLIDPPFEKPDEFARLARQMQEWKKRWPTGCYIIWYPIKGHMPIAELHDEARELGLNRTWAADFLLSNPEEAGLSGSGLLIINTPFGLPERVAGFSQELGALLGGHLETTWLTEA